MPSPSGGGIRFFHARALQSGCPDTATRAGHEPRMGPRGARSTQGCRNSSATLPQPRSPQRARSPVLARNWLDGRGGAARNRRFGGAFLPREFRLDFSCWPGQRRPPASPARRRTPEGVLHPPRPCHPIEASVVCGIADIPAPPAPLAAFRHSSCIALPLTPVPPRGPNPRRQVQRVPPSSPRLRSAHDARHPPYGRPRGRLPALLFPDSRGDSPPAPCHSTDAQRYRTQKCPGR